MILTIPPALDKLPRVCIRTGRRDMLLRQLDGTMGHVPAGSEIAVERHTLASLAPEDYEVLGTVAPAITDHGGI